MPTNQHGRDFITLYGAMRNLDRLAHDLEIRAWKGRSIFLDNDDSVGDCVKGENNQAIEQLETAIIEETRRIRDKRIRIMDRWKKAFKPVDTKSYQRWRENPPGPYEPRYKGLSKRAVQRQKELDAADSRAQQIITFYKLISPHTFCFVPFSSQEDRNGLEKALQPLFDTAQYKPKGSNWVATDPLYVFRDPSHRHYAHVTGYVAQDRKCFKLKYVARHTGNTGKTDKLDVEAEFEGNKFVQIAHYHVEKPQTMQSIVLEDEEQHNVGTHFEVSISRNSGITRHEYTTADGTVHSHLADRERLADWLKVFSIWHTHPVVVGGALFKDAISILQRDTRLEVIQMHYAK